jgi:hydrogenase expression/formation protein HypC
MCLALPSRVTRLEGEMAVVESGDRERSVSLVLLDEAVAVGDYLLVRNGGFAVERLDPEAAAEALATIDDLVAGHDGADIRAW